jgi:hypothetical protein
MHSYFKQFDTFLYKDEPELRLLVGEYIIIGIFMGSLPEGICE